MKSVFKSIKDFLEMWGRARAAAYLARQGDWKSAQALYRD